MPAVEVHVTTSYESSYTNGFLSWVETGLSIWVVDADMVGFYPSVMRAFNTSRMTLTFFPYEIEGKSQTELRRYFSNLTTVRENAVVLGHSFHGLPDYEGMRQLVEQKLMGDSL